jgi:hypothetical protein
MRIEDQLKLHLDNTRNALHAYRERWDRYIQLYKAEQRDPNKDFPWPGCSNVVVPEINAQVSTITSHIYGSTIRQDPIFTVRALRPDQGLVELASKVERFLDFYAKQVQRFDSYWRRSLPYLVLLGTHVVKFRVEPGLLPVVALEPISLHRFFVYPGVRNIESSPFVADLRWVAFEHIYELYRQGQITQRVYETMRSQLRVSNVQSDPFSHERVPPSSIPGTVIPLYDCYFTHYDEQTGKPMRYNALFHYETQTILYLREWSDPLPYELLYYHAQEDSCFGIGVGDLVWTLQEAMTTAINQAIDNATIANTRMVVVPPGSNINPNEPVYPGRVVVSTTPEKIRPWPLGDIYPSATVLPGLIRQTMERVAASSEVLMGMPDTVAKTRATFAGSALNVQMGITRLDYASAEFESGLERIAWRTLEALAKYFHGSTVSYVSRKRTAPMAVLESMTELSPEAEQAYELMESDVFEIPERVSKSDFAIQPSRRTANMQIERQAAIYLAQLTNNYLQQVLQYGQMLLQAPQLQPLVENIWNAANETMRRVLRSFQVENPDRILVEVSEILGGGNAGAKSGGPAGVGAPAEGTTEGAVDELQAGAAGLPPSGLLGLLGGGAASPREPQPLEE